MSSLLDKAKQYQTKRGIVITREDIEMAVAWAKGEISLTQVNGAMGFVKGTGNCYPVLARGLREYIRNGNRIPGDRE